ncbi:MAG: hypothetical protein AAGC71_15145, partial [Pseudomonadota bacterium]
MQTIATRISFERGFTNYVAEQERSQLQRLAGELALVFALTDDWSAFRGNPRRWDQMLRTAFLPEDQRLPSPRRGP